MENYNELNNIAKKFFDILTEENNSHKKKKYKSLLTFTYTTSPIENIQLIDIRITNRSIEDKIYLENDKIFEYLRRGDSLIYNKLTDKYSIARIGLPKFFDYKKNYASNENDLKNRVLSNVINKKNLYLYYTEKANGENFQVSFNKEYNSFVVASKNVSILLRDENDLNFYKNQNNDRYSFVIDFAEIWFKIYNEKIIDKNLFKETLGDYTIIGESVGDLTKQHIKLYNERDVIFYSIIDNKKFLEQLCLPLKESFEIFKKFNLSYVPIASSEKYENFDELKKNLDIKYNEVLCLNVEKGGEGNVVYFCMEEDNKEVVLSLGKLKTFEYRFYRKIREKIKLIINKRHPLNVETAKIRLKNESIELLEDQKDNIDLDKYLQFGYYVLDYNNLDRFEYSNVFAFFLKEMKKNFDNGVDFKSIKTNELHEELKKYLSDNYFSEDSEKEKEEEEDEKLKKKIEKRKEKKKRKREEREKKKKNRKDKNNKKNDEIEKESSEEEDIKEVENEMNEI